MRDDRRGGGRRAIGRRLISWLVGSAVGVLLLALPDGDDRVFSFSDTHGPSPVDLVGMVIVIGAWAPIAALIWSRRAVLAEAERLLVSAALAVGVVLLAVTVGYDLGASWSIPVALLLSPQIFALYAVWKRT